MFAIATFIDQQDAAVSYAHVRLGDNVTVDDSYTQRLIAIFLANLGYTVNI